jgi:hypothetical protein
MRHNMPYRMAQFILFKNGSIQIKRTKFKAFEEKPLNFHLKILLRSPTLKFQKFEFQRVWKRDLQSCAHFSYSLKPIYQSSTCYSLFMELTRLLCNILACRAPVSERMVEYFSSSENRAGPIFLPHTRYAFGDVRRAWLTRRTFLISYYNHYTTYSIIRTPSSKSDKLFAIQTNLASRLLHPVFPAFT